MPSLCSHSFALTSQPGHSLPLDRYPVSKVVEFLEGHKMGQYVAAFQQHGVDGDLLLEANDNVLKELGVASAVDRVKIRTRFKTFVSDHS